MEQTAFTAQIRDLSVKAKNLRKKDLIPAEYYGRGIKNISLQLDYQSFRKMYRKAGSNTVITLQVEGDGTKNVLIHVVDRDPVTNNYSHVEFINVRMDEEVTAMVPVRLEGIAPAVRDFGGVLIQSMDEIEISCLPADLIHEVVLSVESLAEINSGLHVSDIKLSDKIKILSDPESSVAMVAAPREEEVAAATAPAAGEVEITTAKEGEEGAAPAAAASDDKKEKKE